MATPSTTPPPARRAIPSWLTTWSEISVRTLLLLLGVTVVGWLFLELSVVALPFLIALLFTAVLEPLGRRLRERGLHPMLAAWIVFGGMLLFFAGMIALLASVVREQFKELGPKIDEGIVEIEDWLEDGPLGLENPDIKELAQQGAERLNTEGSGKQAVKGVSIAGEFVAGFLITIVMVFFFLKDGRL